MKNEIVAKLNEELRLEITSERQVVYILVEVRKMLEQQDTLDGFPALKLCCDWVVHPKLCGQGAQDVLKRFDNYESEYLNTGLSPANFEPIHGFATHRLFRTELVASLAPHGVDAQVLSSDAYWQAFIRQYMSVIRDCPLEARDGKTQHVAQVSGIAWPEDQMAIFPGKFVIQWNWKLKDGRERQTKETCALI